MNKKTYIAPTMEALNIETIEMIATSQANTFSISDETTDKDAIMSNGHRGTWGNLWE